MDRSTASFAINVAVFDVAPVPPYVEVTAPVVLSKVPAEVAVTVTVSVHVPPATIVPPLKEIVLGEVVV